MANQYRKRKDCCTQHTVIFKLGSGEFLALGARADPDSRALAAWIVGYGLVCTVFARFVHIAGHSRLFEANIRGNRVRGHLKRLNGNLRQDYEIYIFIYIYIRTKLPQTASV